MWDDALGVGVTFATIGILSGVIIGMIIINYGARKGLTKIAMRFEDLPESERTGFVSIGNRKSLGNEVTVTSSIDPLTLQAAIVGIVVTSGFLIRSILIKINPIMQRFPLVGAVLISSMIIGYFINKSKFKDYVDKPSISRINGVALDYMITAAIGTTSITIFTNYALPLLLVSIALVLVNLFFCFLLGRRWLKGDWFETGVGLFGQFCGVLATGLMLVRVVDPDNKTPAAQLISTSSTLGYMWQIPYMVVGSIAIFTAPKITTIISATFFVVCLIAGELIHKR